jgi:general secretion pathway protein L
MTTLVLPLPERPRLAGGQPAPGDGDFDWWLFDAQGQALGEGRNAAAALPKAEQLVLLLPEHALSWHPITLPRTPDKRWRAALVGLLEEQLLEDPETLQLALPPGAAAGEACWVAATPKAPLQEAIERLEAAQRLVDRIMPRSAPLSADQPPEGHFFVEEGGLRLRWTSAEGVAVLPLEGGLARARLPAHLMQTAHWSAVGAAVQGAEAWLGASVAMLTPGQLAWRALSSPWNLRQFELAPRLRGLRWLRQMGHQLLHPQWAAARKGLLVWAGLALLGLNASAWQQRLALQERQQQLVATLKGSFPRIGYVLDPVAQMQREMSTLRAQAGELGEQDFETLVLALAQAWPAERGPVEALHFEGGRLSLQRSGFADEQVEALRQRLASEGWTLQTEQGRLILNKAGR